MDTHTPKTAVTHNGIFHADDVFAAATLLLVYPSLNIIRSRDEHVITEADIVFDVGMIYDETCFRFDHHQESGAGVRKNGIPYSSFGLIWNKFGKQICTDERVIKDIDERLVASVDALDNGMEITVPVKAEYPFRYSVMDIVRLYRPTWEEGNPQSFDNAFFDIVDFAKNILSREIKKTQSKYKAEELILSAYNKSEDKRIIILDRYAPWDETVNRWEEPLFMVYPSLSGNGDWCGEVVRDDPRIYTSQRISFPEVWGGKRDTELEAVTNVTGAVFAHKARFLVVAKTKGAVLQLIEKALNF